MKPDATQHNTDPWYLRELIAKAGLSQREAARRIGISERVMRQYLAPRGAATALPAPYTVQFALERLTDGTL
jgi:transcriptional regulator with XRE-family HTH domain